MSQMVPVDVNRITDAADVVHIEENFDDCIDPLRRPKSMQTYVPKKCRLTMLMHSFITNK